MRIQCVGLLACALGFGACGGKPVTEPGGVIAVQVTPRLDTITVGERIQLAVTVVVLDTAAVNPTVTWAMLDPLIATVSPTGVVTGVRTGSTGVTATSEGVSDTVEIVVVTPLGGPIGRNVTSLGLDHGPWDVTMSAGGALYVTRPRTDSIARVDLDTERILGSFPVGNRPDEVWFNATGTRAYVTNLDDGTVGVIDVPTNAQTTTFPVPAGPLRLRLGPGETKLYVTLDNGTLVVLDAVSGAVTHAITIGSLPNGLALSAAGSRLYASGVGGTVTEINTATDAVTRTFTLGGIPQDLIVAPGDSTLYVADEAGSVEVWDLGSGSRAASVPVPSAFALALTPDASQLWVAQAGASAVSVIDCATLTVVETILTFGTPRHLLITPDARAAVLANEAGAVQIIR